MLEIAGGILLAVLVLFLLPFLPRILLGLVGFVVAGALAILVIMLLTMA